MDGVEQIVYINLAERPEKRLLIEAELRCITNAAQRFDAIKLPNSTGYGVDGYIGSYMSHIAVVKMAMRAGWANCLILEDDAAFNRFDEGSLVLAKLMAAPYDVILLGGLGDSDPATYRITSPCQTSIAYLVARHYYPKLLQLFEDGLDRLMRTSDHGKYALDQYWKLPQLTDAWFMIRPVLMYQQAAISTICGSCLVDVSTWYRR